MEETTILNNTPNIYTVNYDFDNPLNVGDLNNKLFCTFTSLEGIDGLIENLSSQSSFYSPGLPNCVILNSHLFRAGVYSFNIIFKNTIS